MIENSLISNRDVYAAFLKFQRVSSDHKFRTKSIRTKTISNEMEDHITQKLGLPLIYNNHSQAKLNPTMSSVKMLPNQESNTVIEKVRAQSYKIIEKNYEQQLNNFGVESQFLKKIFDIKCQETQTKYNEQRYQIFVKNFALRLCKYKHLPINQMGFSSLCLQTFFQWYIHWRGHITDIDLSYAAELLKGSKMKIIKSLLEQDKKLMKLSLCNSNLDDDQLKAIFTIINQKNQLFSLDISNINSQSLNRLGDSMSLLNQFLVSNQSVAIFKVNNLHIKREGFQQICKAITSRKANPIKILSLSNNHINGTYLCEHFYSIVRSGLSQLDLSSNPLGEQFYKNLPALKGATLRELSLQQTNMNSQHLYLFLEKIEECKTLSVLKLDKNDFSHHWFGKIGQKLQTNSGLEWLSLNNCQIRSFLPLFHGLTQNRYLRRLDASNNTVDCQSEIPKKIIDCFIFNKNLQQIRFRFCNLNEFIINKIMQGLKKNQKLKHLDISQNLMSDTGGNNILKMLQQNERIETIGIEKLPLSQQMRKRIYSKLKENKGLRQKEQFGKLRSLTTDLKAKDDYTWDDVIEMEEQDRITYDKLKLTQQKVKKLENIASSKRESNNELAKKNSEDLKKLQSENRDKIRQQNQRVRQAQKKVNNLAKQEVRIRQLQNKQAEQIKLLQRKIKQANEKNKSRENELQEKLRNFKYLQRKKSKGIHAQYSPKKNSRHIH